MTGRGEKNASSVRSWIDFWDGDHAIYVSERHKQLHAANVGRDIARHLPSPSAVVLDHGCADALYAEALARQCGQLLLCDAAETVRANLAARTQQQSNIAVVDPAAVEAWTDGSFDLIVSNSLIQYLSRPQLEHLLDVWRVKLKPNGRLLVADVIPPGVSPLTDAMALLRFAWSGGFVGAALAGLVRTALSDYGKIRARLGFATYAEDEFLAILAQHGLAGQRIRPNLGHNQARMAFAATRADSARG